MNQEVMVVLGDGGKPITIIRTREPAAVDDVDGRRRPGFVVGGRQTKAALQKGGVPSAVEVKKLETRTDRENISVRSKDFEGQVELRRLRVENHLLHQRIANLEMAMSRADNSGSNGKMASSGELAASQNPTLDSATSSNGPMPTSIESNASQNHSPATSQNPCQQSTEEKQSAGDMSSNQESEMQRLQDELVACKMREAEANLSMKEFEQKLNQLERHWQHFLCESRADNDGKSPSQPDLKETVMGLRLRETHLVSGMNDLKQSLMELETQNHIYERQIKRQEAEQATLLETISAAEAKERELMNTISQLERKVSNMESRCQEDAAMSRIREAEYSQTIAEMRRRIAELEIENQELLTSAKLHNRDSANSENGVAGLQDDELRMAAPGFRQLISAPEDDDDDDDDDIVATNSFSHRFHDTDMFDLPNMSQLAKDNLLMTSSFVEHISHSDIDSSFAEQFGSHADTDTTASLDDSQMDSSRRQAEDGS